MIISVHLDTLRTIFGQASERLILNYNALSLSIDHSSLASSPWLGDEGEPSSFVSDDDDEELGGGNMKAPCRLPLPAENGHPAIGVGLQSTGGWEDGSREKSEKGLKMRYE